MCNGRYGYNTFDINEFINSQIYIGSECGNPEKNDKCYRTATVFGVCHNIDDINYILWGMLSQICQSSMFSAKSVVVAYRMPLGSLDTVRNFTPRWRISERTFWTEVGYNYSFVLSTSISLSRTIDVFRELLSSSPSGNSTCKPCSYKYTRDLTVNVLGRDSLYGNGWIPFWADETDDSYLISNTRNDTGSFRGKYRMTIDGVFTHWED